jgi:ABC-type Fe3+ transport system substrate-binding protein
MRLSPQLLHAAFPQDSLAGVRLYDATRNASGDPAPKWVGVVLSSFGIVYNQQLYSTLGLSPPRAWADLTDPRLFGFVALADPAHSGSASVSYMMVLQRSMADDEQALLDRRPELRNLPSRELKNRAEYQGAIAHGWRHGMGQLLLIAANARYFSDSSELVPNDVARGEAAAGMAIDFYARVTEGTVGPERARFVSPYAATAITPDPVGILYGASGQQLILATRFVQFLLSPEGQRLWILQPGTPDGPSERSLRRMPIRRDVYQDQTGWADHFNPFEEAGGFNQRGEWMALMGDTLPFWEAAWIDSRDALIDSYSKILRVKDMVLRERLLMSLSDLPVTLHDVEDRRAARLQLQQTHGDIDEWNARQRIQWGNRFRKHYQDVASHT